MSMSSERQKIEDLYAMNFIQIDEYHARLREIGVAVPDAPAAASSSSSSSNVISSTRLSLSSSATFDGYARVARVRAHAHVAPTRSRCARAARPAR